MLPFKISPVYKAYLWGGSKLKSLYNKKNNLEITAESWELSAHKDGVCHIDGGALDGMLFSDFIKRYPQAVGRAYKSGQDFPILIKLIDAQKDLSIQVHPDDKYAKREENSNGKTEMWYVLDCRQGSFLYYGFEKEISREELKRAVYEKRLIKLLRKVDVKKGDVFFIEAGTVHAIGAGVTVVEIQQNSNITYRIDDYGRLDADGKPRRLHIEKALAVIKPVRAAVYTPENGYHVETEQYSYKQFPKCKYFTAGRLKLNGSIFIHNDGSSFYSYVCIDGESVLCCDEKLILSIKKGDSVFFPANAPRVKLSGTASFIVTTL